MVRPADFGSLIAGLIVKVPQLRMHRLLGDSLPFKTTNARRLDGNGRCGGTGRRN